MKKENKHRTFGLEEIYFKLDKQINLVDAYCNSNMSFIIKSCRLKPVKYFNQRTSNLTLYRDWFDEFNYTLHITQNKQIKIFNSVNIGPVPCTDLYFNLPLQEVIKISKLAYIQYGTCDATMNKIGVISLLGIDNYFRTYAFDQEWKQTSTLILGNNNLQKISKQLDILDPIDIMESSIPMMGSKQFLTPLPISIETKSLLSKDSSVVNNLF